MKHLKLFTVLVLLFVLQACNRYGEEVNYNKLQIYYKDGATKEDASRLGDYLIRTGYSNTDNDRITIQLRKEGGKYLFRMVGKPGVEDNPAYEKTFKSMASELSAAIFNNMPVAIHICDNTLHTKRVFEMMTKYDWDKYSGEGVEIRHPATWNFEEYTPDATRQVNSIFEITPKEEQYADHKVKVSLLSENLAGNNMDLDEYMRVSIGNLRTLYSDYDYKLIQSSYENKEAQPQGKLTWTITRDGINMRYEQIVVVKDNNAYILTFGIRQDDATEKLSKTAREMMSTFNVN